MFDRMIESDEFEFKTLPVSMSGLFVISNDTGDEAEKTKWLRNAWMTIYA